MKRFATMSEPAKMTAAAAASIAAGVALATVRNGPVDAADGVVLVASLAVLARSAIRVASDPGARQWRDH